MIILIKLNNLVFVSFNSSMWMLSKKLAILSKECIPTKQQTRAISFQICRNKMRGYIETISAPF